MQNLAELIDEAYTLFSAYEMGNVMAVCTECCLLPSDAKLLQVLPLKQLDARLIYQYLDAVVKDDGLIIQQVKHLLPRILELLLEDAHLRHSKESLLDKCHCDQPDAWTVSELAFMQRFALSYFEWLVTVSQSNTTLDEAVLMFHTAGLNIVPLLALWERLLDYPKALHDLLVLIAYDLKQSSYQHSFANADSAAKIDDWLNRPAFKTKLVNSILAAQSSSILSEDEQWLYDSMFNAMT